MTPYRTAAFALLLSAIANAQFSGLSSTEAGSSLYFVSTLRLRGAAEPLNGKVFIASTDGVQLFRLREPAGVPLGSPLCSVGGFQDYLGAESAAAGVTALFYRAEALSCSYPPYTLRTQVLTPSGESELPGIARVSANGTWSIVYSPRTGRLYDGLDVTFFNLQTRSRTDVAVAVPGFPHPVLVPYTGGRVIANDGTALLAFDNGGYLLKPNSAPVAFPVQDGVPLVISADASRVVYRKQDIYLLDMHTKSSTLLIPAVDHTSGYSICDDGTRVTFLRDGQVHVIDTVTLNDRALTNDAGQITEATISGDGGTLYAATSLGGLLMIDANSGNAITLIGRTPYLNPIRPMSLMRGMAPIFTGSALSDSTIRGTPPFNPWLDQVTTWIGETKVPLIELTPTSLRLLVPWNLPAGPTRVVAEITGDRTPFDFPEVAVDIPPAGIPVAGAIARQDWTQTFVGPINTGEIIHVYAAGLGPVSPEPPPGAAAPSTEPLARITQPLTCTNAKVLYAGLAPGAVERVYQVDIRIGPTPGYQKFTCTLGGSEPFVFLTLNVVE